MSKIAVVTGGNKGVGFEICRQLADHKLTVVLTARDPKRGSDAVAKLHSSGLSDVVFHQLDVTDPASIASFANFIDAQFRKLEIGLKKTVKKRPEKESNPGFFGCEIKDLTIEPLFKIDNGFIQKI